MRVELLQLRADDVPRIAATKGGAAWKSDARWGRYLKEQSQGLRLVLLAEEDKTIVAYGSLAWASQNPAFRSARIPEIQDLVVAESRRGAGVGTCLVRALEERARAAGFPKVGIGVGLYRDYGAAQRLYWRLGYVPDGQGVTYRNITAAPMSTVTVDDELVLWLVRDVSQPR